jgi:WD40 repeat protein
VKIGIGQVYDKTQSLVILKENGKVKLLNVNTKEEKPLSQKLEKFIVDIDISPDKTKFATVDIDGKVQLWNFSGDAQFGQPVITSSRINKIILGSDNSQDSTNYWMTIEDKGRAKIRRGSLTEAKELPDYEDGIGSASFNPNEQIIATVLKDDIKFWDIKGKPVNINVPIKTGIPRIVKFSLDGKFLAILGDDKTIQIWKILKHENQFSPQLVDLKQKIDKVTIVEFSPVYKKFGELIATANDPDKVVKLWDLQGRQVAEFNVDWDKTVSISFSSDPDAQQIAIAATGDNSTIKLWEMKDLHSLLDDSCKWLDNYFQFHPEENKVKFYPKENKANEKLCPPS